MIDDADGVVPAGLPFAYDSGAGARDVRTTESVTNTTIVGGPTVRDGAPTPSADAPTTAHAPLDASAAHAPKHVSTALDHAALARGMHGEIDLGDAGRVAVTTHTPRETLEVLVRAEHVVTAAAIARHAPDIAADLASIGREAHVAVATTNAPTTFASSDASRGSGAWGHGGRQPDARDRGDDAGPAPTAMSAERPRRVRFVL